MCYLPSVSRWKAPPITTYKVDWDVAIDKLFGRMGLGAIVGNHMGFVIAAKSLSKMENLEPAVAEALGALYAAKFSRDLGIRSIIMEGDALQLVNAIKSE
jgi:hypothetical protein